MEDQAQQTQQHAPAQQHAPSNTIANVIMKNKGGDFDGFVGALNMVGETHKKEILDMLSGKNMHTAFIPTTNAFKMAKAEMAKWMKAFPCPDSTEMEAKKRDYLASLLKYHIVPGMYNKFDLNRGGSIKTMNGEFMCLFQIKELNGVYFNGLSSHLEGEGMTVANGRIYRLSNVLFPMKECTPLKQAPMGSTQ